MSFSPPRIAFLFSVLVFSFIYGVAVGKWKVFPHSFLDKAVSQSRAFFGNDSRYHNQFYDRRGVKTFVEDEVYPGPTAITSWWKESSGPEYGIRLIGSDGNLWHKWTIDRHSVFGGTLSQRFDPLTTDIQGSIVLPNGDVVMNLEYVGMVRVNSCGKVLWRITEGNHHSIEMADDGSFWVPGVSQKPQSKSSNYPEGFPGLGSVWIDRAINVGMNGVIKMDISIPDILYSNKMIKYLHKYRNKSGDVTHINDIEPLSGEMSSHYPIFEKGDLLISMKHINIVMVVDPDNKKVKWYTGKRLALQHDADYMGDGWVGVFDNNVDRMGGNLRGGSRIVAFQPHTDSVKVIFEGDNLERFYTSHRGKWQGLPNGNMLLTEEETGRVVEVNSHGSPVWEWIHEPIRNSKVPPVTKATRLDLTREDVASWPCSSIDSVRTSVVN